MPTNLELVQALYTAFANGDIAGATAVMADDIVWHEAENNKLADCNPYVGQQSVVEGVFVRMLDDFDDFEVDIGSFVASGNTVAMQGRYRGTAKATGEKIDPQIVHWWTMQDGKITAFQQHVDTLALARALGEA